MLEISNEALSLTCKDNGTGTVLADKRRGTRWVLDERTREYHPIAPFDPAAYHIRDDDPHPIGPGQAKVTDAGVLEQQFTVLGEQVTYRWRLLADGVEIELAFERGGENLERIALPGFFAP